MHFRRSLTTQNHLPDPGIEPEVFGRPHRGLVTVPNEPDTMPWHLNSITTQSLASRRKLEQITHYHARLINGGGTRVIMSSKEIQRSRRADNYSSLRLVLSPRKQGRPRYATILFSLGSRVTKSYCESQGPTRQRT
jgi:hypothetical protein